MILILPGFDPAAQSYVDIKFHQDGRGDLAHLPQSMLILSKMTFKIWYNNKGLATTRSLLPLLGGVFRPL
jgi:hypothetical protein